MPVLRSVSRTSVGQSPERTMGISSLSCTPDGVGAADAHFEAVAADVRSRWFGAIELVSTPRSFLHDPSPAHFADLFPGLSHSDVRQLHAGLQLIRDAVGTASKIERSYFARAYLDPSGLSPVALVVEAN